MRCCTPAVLICLATAALPAAGQVYVGTSSNGSVVLSNFASVEAPSKLIVVPDSTAEAKGAIPALGGAVGPEVGSIVLQVAREESPSESLSADRDPKLTSRAPERGRGRPPESRRLT